MNSINNGKFLTRKPPFPTIHSLNLLIKLVPLFSQQKWNSSPVVHVQFKPWWDSTLLLAVSSEEFDHHVMQFAQ